MLLLGLVSEVYDISMKIVGVDMFTQKLVYLHRRSSNSISEQPSGCAEVLNSHSRGKPSQQVLS